MRLDSGKTTGLRPPEIHVISTYVAIFAKNHFIYVIIKQLFSEMP